VLGIRVLKSQGEETRKMLMDKGLLKTGYKIFTDDKYIYFPTGANVEGKECLDLDFEQLDRKENYIEKLASVLPEDLIKEVHTFDSIGDIAILELQDTLIPYATKIGEVFLSTHTHFKTVLCKAGSLEGDFRTRQYSYLAGEHRTNTVSKEYGLRFELDLKKVFFSPRLATERMRIARLVQENENVIDMFCGIGPFSISIAKYSNPKCIYAIDLNPDAIYYLKRNIELNKVSGIVPICGDAKKEVLNIPSADRIVMNLPKFSHKFLDGAIGSMKEGIIHYYTIVSEGEEDKCEAFIKQQAALKGKEASILQKINVKPYAPHSYMAAYDIKITFLVPQSF